MKDYLFITNDGYTYDTEKKKIDNMQILGSARGRDIKEAFKSFKENQSYLKEFTFKEVLGLEFIGGFIRNLEL